MEKGKVIFDDKTIDFVLEATGLHVDKDGYLIDKNEDFITVDKEKVHKNDIVIISNGKIITDNLDHLLDFIKNNGL